VALEIIGAADAVAERMAEAIRAALPGAAVEVAPGGPGHFEVSVIAEAFRGRSTVQQHQLVYGAIAPLMAGDAPPVHAIDRLSTRAPER
jgi:acid stress-induced BolA-like protein IbaG/YrbA